jgi:putative FmdB family regulatory protein
MPLYEYHCPPCAYTFEILASLSEATKKKPCPVCGKRAPRIASAFAIASGGNGHDEVLAGSPTPRDPRPLCMQYPQVPLSCHMDEPSLRRFVAHSQGRGNEHDDKQAQQTEIRKQRGMPEPTVAPPAHGHSHGHDHSRNMRRHAQSQTHTHKHEHGKGKAKSHTHSAHSH